ncbi:MAG: biopolymer transporter ExbD [Deltaproteobacteria bacterium]|nr:MAG: biopolymer transporter ExbD [Deltaproteobacteria bacterium]
MAISVRMQARKRYRQLKKRVPEPDPISHLNITPMMDMMTILLLFFLKNFQVSGQVQPSEEMTPPKSSAQIEAKTTLQITITKKSILVADKPVASVKKGEVDSSLKRDGQSGFLIMPLMEVLQQHATRLKTLEKRKYSKFEGEAVIIADHTIPYRLLSEVLYTAGQAEFGKYRLLVLQSGP